MLAAPKSVTRQNFAIIMFMIVVLPVLIASLNESSAADEHRCEGPKLHA